MKKTTSPSPYSWFTELAEQHIRLNEEHDMPEREQKMVRDFLGQMSQLFGGYDDRDATEAELVGDALYQIMHFCLANKIDFAARLKKSQDVFEWHARLKEP